MLWVFGKLFWILENNKKIIQWIDQDAVFEQQENWTAKPPLLHTLYTTSHMSKQYTNRLPSNEPKACPVPNEHFVNLQLIFSVPHWTPIQWTSTTLICALRFPNANLITFHTNLSIYCHIYKIKYLLFHCCWINKGIQFLYLVLIQGNLHAQRGNLFVKATLSHISV